MSLLIVADRLNRDLISASIYDHGNWIVPGGIRPGAEMAIAIEGYSVVGRKDHIDDIYPGGVEALTASAPNSTVLADDHLWRCSFMAMSDARRFVRRLTDAGFEVARGPDSDFVIVNEFDLCIEPYCEWLQVKQWNKGVIAWLTGTVPKTLIAREGWTPEIGSGLVFAESRNNPNLKFLRVEGNLEVYFDKAQGSEVYIGRTHFDPETVFRVSADVIRKHMINPGHPPVSGVIAETVRKAVSDLETLGREYADSWRLHFCIGKGKHAVGDLDGALLSLRRAYELEKETESVPREYAGICLELGYADEAVQVGEKAAALKPDNSETLGNLACAYLFAGRLEEANTTIGSALKLDANDSVNQLLRRMIADVASGRRPQPKMFSDLTRVVTGSETPSKSPELSSARQSIWDRIRFWKKS